MCLLEAPGKNLFPCLSYLPEAACIPCLMVSSSVPKAGRQHRHLPVSLFLYSFLPLPVSLTLALCKGPLWLHWPHKDNAGQSAHLHIPNLITPAKPLCPCKLTIHVSGLGCGHLGGILILSATTLNNILTTLHFLFQAETSPLSFRLRPLTSIFWFCV